MNSLQHLFLGCFFLYHEKLEALKRRAAKEDMLEMTRGDAMEEWVLNRGKCSPSLSIQVM